MKIALFANHTYFSSNLESPNPHLMHSQMVLISIILLISANLFGERLSLKESLEIALRNNLEIHQAREEIIEAKAKKREAFASFLPELGSSSSFTRLNEETEFYGTTITSNELYDLNLNLTQPLFTGGELTALYRQAKETKSLAEANYRKVEIDLILKVKNAYYNILKAEKICAVSEEAVEQLLAHLKVVEDFYKAEMAPRVDILKAQVQLADIKQGLVEAENGLELAKASFNNLLNRNLSVPVELVDIIEYQNKEFDLKDSIEKAFQLRPELRTQEINLKIAKESLCIAKSEYLPTISLISNYDYTKGSEIPIDKWQESWNVAIAFELDIWNWGRTKEKVKQAKSVINQSQDSLSLLKNNVELEIRNAFLNLEAAEKKISVTEKAVAQSKEGLRMTELRFKEGMATSTDVLDATTLQSQAETNYYQALYDCYLAEAALKRAMGEK